MADHFSSAFSMSSASFVRLFGCSFSPVFLDWLLEGGGRRSTINEDGGNYTCTEVKHSALCKQASTRRGPPSPLSRFDTLAEWRRATLLSYFPRAIQHNGPSVRASVRPSPRSLRLPDVHKFKARRRRRRRRDPTPSIQTTPSILLQAEGERGRESSG